MVVRSDLAVFCAHELTPSQESRSSTWIAMPLRRSPNNAICQFHATVWFDICLTSHLSKRDSAKLAQEQSAHLYLCVLIADLTQRYGPVVRQAKVIGVLDAAFDVLIPEFGIEKRVHVDQMPIDVSRAFDKIYCLGAHDIYLHRITYMTSTLTRSRSTGRLVMSSLG